RFLEILFEKLKNTVEAKAFFFFAFGFWNIPILRIWSAGRRISVENQVLDFLGEFIERCAEIESVCVGSELERALKNCGRGTWTQATVEEWTAKVVKKLAWVEIVLRAKAVAGGAGTVRRIEAEGTRLEYGNADAAIGASELLRKDVLLAANDGDGNKS